MDTFYISASNATVTPEGATANNQQIWRIRLRAGRPAELTKIVDIPGAGLLNGVTGLDPANNILLVADSALGPLMVGATEAGVCFIGFAEDAQALEGDLRRRFPAARVEPAGEALAETVRAVVGFIEEPTAALALPLDLRGTAFQRRVWEALQAIPFGETRTYGELAALAGAPGADGVRVVPLPGADHGGRVLKAAVPTASELRGRVVTEVAAFVRACAAPPAPGSEGGGILT